MKEKRGLGPAREALAPRTTARSCAASKSNLRRPSMDYQTAAAFVVIAVLVLLLAAHYSHETWR